MIRSMFAWKWFRNVTKLILTISKSFPRFLIEDRIFWELWLLWRGFSFWGARNVLEVEIFRYTEGFYLLLFVSFLWLSLLMWVWRCWGFSCCYPLLDSPFTLEPRFLKYGGRKKYKNSDNRSRMWVFCSRLAIDLCWRRWREWIWYITCQVY